MIKIVYREQVRKETKDIEKADQILLLKDTLWLCAWTTTFYRLILRNPTIKNTTQMHGKVLS